MSSQRKDWRKIIETEEAKDPYADHLASSGLSLPDTIDKELFDKTKELEALENRNLQERVLTQLGEAKFPQIEIKEIKESKSEPSKLRVFIWQGDYEEKDLPRVARDFVMASTASVVELANCLFSESQIKTLFAMINVNSHVKKLVVNRCGLIGGFRREERAMSDIILGQMVHNTNLETFDCRDAKVDSVDIALMLERNSTLKTLVLGSVDDFEPIFNALERNKTHIQEIIFTNTNLTDAQKQFIDKKVKSNDAIKSLSFVKTVSTDRGSRQDIIYEMKKEPSPVGKPNV